MIDTITVYTFRDAMVRRGWTVDGAIALFDLLETYEEETGATLEFDPIAFDCQYSEQTLEELLDYYDDLKEDLKEFIQEEAQTTLPEYLQVRRIIASEESRNGFVLEWLRDNHGMACLSDRGTFIFSPC